MKLRLRALWVSILSLAVCVPLVAHHGNVAYDTSKAVVLKEATVTKFVWANPHSVIQFDVKDEKGNRCIGLGKRAVHPRLAAGLEPAVRCSPAT